MVGPSKAAPRGRPRLSLPALALAAGLLLSGCEFLGLDVFPASLQNARGSIDLDSRVASLDGAVLGYVQEIERLGPSATGASYLLVLCETDLGRRLLVLDPESLATVAYLSDSRIGTPVAVDANGQFVSGSALIDAAFGLSTNPYASLSGRLVVATASSTNLVLSASGGALSCDERSSDWTTSMGSGAKTISEEYAYYLVDAAAPSDGSLRLLFRADGSGKLELGFGSVASFLAALAAASPTSLAGWVEANPTLASETPLPQNSDSRSWLCAGGIVAPSYERESRLVRYGYGTGTALDSRLFRSEWARGLSFDYGGNGWYYYDSRSGRLYSMGVWW